MSNLQIEIMQYYTSAFSALPPNQLFEVYDTVNETFVTFPGNDGSKVMNKTSLIKRLTELELYNKPFIESIIVLSYNKEDITFNSPVFIGRRDCFKGKLHKNDVEHA